MNKKLRILSPCDKLVWTEGETSNHCADCNVDVVDLSQYTEDEALGMKERGEYTCGSYRVSRDGQPLFLQQSRNTLLAAGTALLVACTTAENGQRVIGEPPLATSRVSVQEASDEIDKNTQDDQAASITKNLHAPEVATNIATVELSEDATIDEAGNDEQSKNEIEPTKAEEVWDGRLIGF